MDVTDGAAASTGAVINNENATTNHAIGRSGLDPEVQTDSGNKSSDPLGDGSGDRRAPIISPIISKSAP